MARYKEVVVVKWTALRGREAVRQNKAGASGSLRNLLSASQETLFLDLDFSPLISLFEKSIR
jgi:hypothetical protein